MPKELPDILKSSTGKALPASLQVGVVDTTTQEPEKAGFFSNLFREPTPEEGRAEVQKQFSTLGFVGSILRGAGLGGVSEFKELPSGIQAFIPSSIPKGIREQLKTPAVAIGGELAGEIAPIFAGEKIARSLLRKAPLVKKLPKILRTAISGATSGAAFETVKAAGRGELPKKKEVVKTAGIFGGLGAAGTAIGAGVKAAGRLKKVIPSGKVSIPIGLDKQAAKEATNILSKETPISQAGKPPPIKNPASIENAFGKKITEENRDRIVNVLGTPEVVLKDKGIVEPFMEADRFIKTDRVAISRELNKGLGLIKKGSKEDVALFNKLNDPSAVLSDSEQKIRTVLDDLLERINISRKARGQELIPKRKGYITHIVDFAREEQKIFPDINIPKSLRFAFEKRLGSGVLKRSAIEALTVYPEAALRDIHLGNALHKAVPKLEQLGTKAPVITIKNGQHFYNLGSAPFGTERAFAEAFVKRQLGFPDAFERSIHAVSKAFPFVKEGLTPQRQRKASQVVTALFYRSLIGAAVDTSVKNLTQGVNTLSEFGIAPTLRGYGKLFTKAGRKQAKSQNLLEEFEPLLHGGEEIKLTGAIKTIGKAIDNTVLAGPMRFAEMVNRGASYHAAMDVALKKGMSVEAANVFAREKVRKLQFAYGKLNISPYAQSSVTRPLFQFTSFPLKQTELLYRWGSTKGERGKLLRYLGTTGALVMGGKYADIDVSSIFLDPFKMIDPEIQQGFKLPGSDKRLKFSLDKLASSGFIPQGPAPVISGPAKVIGLALSGDDEKIERSRREAVKLFLPGGRYSVKVKDAIPQFKGEPITGKRARLIKNPTKTDIALWLIGLRRTEDEIKHDRISGVLEIKKDFYTTLRRATDLVIAGKGEEGNKKIQEVLNKYPFLYDRAMEYMSGKNIDREAKRKVMTFDESFFDEKLHQVILQGIKTPKQAENGGL